MKVKREEINKKVDLSGSWNDTDSRLVAEEMVKDCLARRGWMFLAPVTAIRP